MIFEDIEKRCVKDGKIQYHLIPDVIMDHSRYSIDKYQLYKSANGYALCLENKLGNQSDTRNALKKGLFELDKGVGLFTPPMEEFKVVFIQ